LDEGIHEFNNMVLEGAKQACRDLADYNVSGEFQIITKPNTRQKMITRMREMDQEGFDGVIISPSGDLKDFDKAIEDLTNNNTIVATVISDSHNSKRKFSVRNNGRVAGKIAAELLWMLAPNKSVAFFTGYKDSEIHKDHIIGFQEQLKAKPMELVAIYENYDDPDIAYHATDKLLRDYPDLGGLYIATANSATVCKKIVELGIHGKINIVASDLFPELNQYLIDGVVHATMFQQPFQQGRLAFRNLYEHIAEGKAFDDVILLKPQIVLSSNLELF